MALREIITLPDKRLRLTSEPVKAVDAELRKLVDDMFETMYEAPGVGLAAPQLDELVAQLRQDAREPAADRPVGGGDCRGRAPGLEDDVDRSL